MGRFNTKREINRGKETDRDALFTLVEVRNFTLMIGKFAQIQPDAPQLANVSSSSQLISDKTQWGIAPVLAGNRTPDRSLVVVEERQTVPQLK